MSSPVLRPSLVLCFGALVTLALCRSASGQGQVSEPTAYLSIVGENDNQGRMGQGTPQNPNFALQVSGDQISQYLKTLHGAPDSIYKGPHILTPMDDSFDDPYAQEHKASSRSERNYDDGYYNYDAPETGYDEESSPSSSSSSSSSSSASRKYDSYAYDYEEEERSQQQQQQQQQQQPKPSAAPRKTSSSQSRPQTPVAEKYEKPSKDSYGKTKKPQYSKYDETTSSKKSDVDFVALRDMLGDLVKQIETLKSGQGRGQQQQQQQSEQPSRQQQTGNGRDNHKEAVKPLPTDYLDYEYAKKPMTSLPSLPPYPLTFPSYPLPQMSQQQSTSQGGQADIAVTTYPVQSNPTRRPPSSSVKEEKKIFMKANELLKMLTGSGVPSDAQLAQLAQLASGGSTAQSQPKRQKPSYSHQGSQDSMASSSSGVPSLSTAVKHGQSPFPYNQMYPQMSAPGFYPPYPYAPMPFMNYGPYHPLAKHTPCAQAAKAGGYPFGPMPFLK